MKVNRAWRSRNKDMVSPDCCYCHVWRQSCQTEMKRMRHLTVSVCQERESNRLKSMSHWPDLSQVAPPSQRKSNKMKLPVSDIQPFVTLMKLCSPLWKLVKLQLVTMDKVDNVHVCACEVRAAVNRLEVETLCWLTSFWIADFLTLWYCLLSIPFASLIAVACSINSLFSFRPTTHMHIDFSFMSRTCHGTVRVVASKTVEI